MSNPMTWRDRLVGAHISTAGGVSKAFSLANILECTAIQIFSKNNNQWMAKNLSQKEVEAFHAALTASSVRFVFSHAGYLINLAAPDRDIHTKSLESMQLELERAELLNLPFVVLHPGSHREKGVEWGIGRIVDSINRLFDHTHDFSAGIALEVTAGQGSSIGHRFEQIAEIVERIDCQERIGVCFDTAHAFAAGYDFRTEETYDAMWRQFESVIGFKRLRAIHLNDSKKKLASRVDRHQHLGKGFLGREPFRFLMNDERLQHLPMVLETPKEGDPEVFDRKNLNFLKSLLPNR